MRLQTWLGTCECPQQNTLSELNPIYTVRKRRVWTPNSCKSINVVLWDYKPFECIRMHTNQLNRIASLMFLHFSDSAQVSHQKETPRKLCTTGDIEKPFIILAIWMIRMNANDSNHSRSFALIRNSENSKEYKGFSMSPLVRSLREAYFLVRDLGEIRNM